MAAKNDLYARLRAPALAQLSGPVGGTPGPSPTRPNRCQVAQRPRKSAKTSKNTGWDSGFARLAKMQKTPPKPTRDDVLTRTLQEGAP